MSQDINLIRDLMEYGELRLWNCDRWVYAELHLEIPVDGVRVLMAQQDTLFSAVHWLTRELDLLRDATPSQSDRKRSNTGMPENRSA